MRLLTALSAGIAFVAMSGFRPDDPDSQGLFRFEPGYDVENFDSEGGRVRVHFTREGPDKVKLNDLDTDGVPDAVEQVATDYEAVLVHFAELGFRAPVSDLDTATGDGGSDRLDVYLVDFGGQADGAFVRERCEFSRPICSGYIAQENDYAGYGYPSFRVASRILASHELFHAVQAAYDADQGANWSEGSAVWASEHFDPSLPDFEYFIEGWLSETDRSMGQEPIGPVDGYSYGLAIFAQYLSERFGDDIHVRLWEMLEDGAGGVADPNWRDALASLLETDEGVTFAEAFVEFGNWVLRCGHGGGGTFENAAEYPRAVREVESLPFEDDRLRVYPLSMQLWSVAAAGRAEVEVALPSADAGELEGVRLVLATRKGDKVASEVIVETGTRGAIAAAGVDEVVVLVVNTGLSGQSQRPGLCIGDRAEVAACVGRIAPEPQPEPGPEAVEPAPEAVEAEAEVEGAEREVQAPHHDDGGCASGTAGLGVWVGLAGVVFGRRRSRPGRNLADGECHRAGRAILAD
jgi:hypothetical protein